MSLFVIADTHLSERSEKPMDIFGYRWNGWTEKLCTNWKNTVSDGDTVVIPGDISWAMTLEEVREDLLLLDSLPGTKIIGKGNHDFWWNTVKKNEEFFKASGITTLNLLYNNSYFVDGKVICGCRGWYVDEKNAPENAEYEKVVMREAGRLERSLKSAESYCENAEKKVFFHFPPVFNGFVCEELVEVLKKHGVTDCYFGHIHGKYDIEQVNEYCGIKFTLISADYLNFKPFEII